MPVIDEDEVFPQTALGSRTKRDWAWQSSDYITAAGAGAKSVL